MTRKGLLITICVTIAVLLVVAVPIGVKHTSGGKEFETIVIDAGHGGYDGGVVASDGTKESDVNLKIAKLLERTLRSKGYNVVMTREDSKALAPTKKGDMQSRRERIERANASLVVSVHCNRFEDSSRRGVQVFYDDTKKWHKEADVMQAVLNEYINKVYGARHDYVAIGGDYFMTKCTDTPSIIVECGFMTNASDLALLKDNQYIARLCEVIAMGVDTIIAY